MNGDLQHNDAAEYDDASAHGSLNGESGSMAVGDTNNQNDHNDNAMLSHSQQLEMEAAEFFRNEANGASQSSSMDMIEDDEDDDMLDEDEDDLDSFEIDPLILGKLTTQFNLFPRMPTPASPTKMTLGPVPYVPEEAVVPKLPYIYERFAEVFNIEEIGSVPLGKLMELRKYLSTLPHIEHFFEAIPFANLVHLSTNLVETILHLVDDIEDMNDLIIRHVRSYMGFLCTCGLRSSRFRATFERHSALHWLGMLRFEPLRFDVVNSLCHFTTELTTLYSDENFFFFLAELIHNYQYFMDNSEQRIYIFNYVGRLLTTYPFFMYRAHDQLKSTVFNEFLVIVERLVRFDMLLGAGVGDRTEPILPSAVLFVVKFFDMTVDDFKLERVDYHMLCSRLCRLMDIMNHLIRNTTSFYSAFVNPTIMHHVCALMDLLVKGDDITTGLPPLQHPPPARKRRTTEADATTESPSNGSSNPEIVDIDTNLPSIEHGPPERKYARKRLSQDSIDPNDRPMSSAVLYPLPSTEIISVDAATAFRSREAFLNLFKLRKISRFYVVNMKRSVMRLVGAMCIASSDHRDIAAEYHSVDLIFKMAKVGDLVKPDYVPLVKRTLVDLCTDHPKNTAALNEIEPAPCHLVTKEDVLALLLPENQL